jgi:hypothetical protein
MATRPLKEAVIINQQLCEGCDLPVSLSDRLCPHCGRQLSTAGAPTIRLQGAPTALPIEEIAPARPAWLWGALSVAVLLLAGILLVNRVSVAQRDQMPTPVTTIGVAANRGWQQSDVTLQKGARFRVEYISGQWTYWAGKIPLQGVDGDTYACRAGACCEPLPQAHKGALIGKIGQDVFLIGNGGSFTANAHAPLFLRINDCDGALSDNAGSVTIKITRS